MKRIFSHILIITLLITSSCSDNWSDHYEKPRESVNIKIWDTLQTMEQYSEFLKYARLFKLDTIIKSANTKTLFIPGNEAFFRYLNGDTTGFSETMRYHIVSGLFMIRNVQDYYKLQTLENKYALISHKDNVYYFDDIEITYSSPFFLDGKYYETDEVVLPKPNLYEYLKWNNKYIQKYIDSENLRELDRARSKPLYFNEQGQTVYDSVIIITNQYETKYFAISKEYRDITATLVVPEQEAYENALNEMVGVLGGSYSSFEDIPVAWQNNVLIPSLLHMGTYGGLLNPSDFGKKKIANIIGDSIDIDFIIDPDSRFICSNGIVYNYSSFKIGTGLYREHKLEAEFYTYPIGLNRYVWDEEFITIEGDKKFQPVEQAVPGASNDTVVTVTFTPNYKEKYAAIFKRENVFPGKYRLIWRTNFRTSGLFAIYVNGKRINLGLMNLTQYDTSTLSSGFLSVLGYRLFPDSKGFCDVDCWVTLEDYGDVFIKLEYLGPGRSTDNGLSIDYIELKP